MADVEVKFHDVNPDGDIAVDTSIIQANCNAIAQGFNQVQRVGRKCTIVGIDWKYVITLPATEDRTEGEDIVRIMLYVDKQANGLTAVASGATGILIFNDVLSFENKSNQERFEVLMDKTIAMNSPGGAGDGSAIDLLGRKEYEEYHLECNIELEFDEEATFPRTNNVGVLVASDHGFCQLESQMRVSFVG